MRGARAAVLVALFACAAMSGATHAQSRPPARMPAPGDHPNFSGDWRLNRELSDEAPARDENQPAPGARPGGFGGFGGRGRFGGRGGYGASRRSVDASDDRATMLEAIGDARSPSPTLTISHSPGNIAITDARGRTRFFQTTGARDKHQYGAGTLDSTTSWIGDQLVMQYDLGPGRRLTSTYSFVPATKQLVVRIRIDSGAQYGARGATTYKYVYDAAAAR
jgi:hypothetical protein